MTACDDPAPRLHASEAEPAREDRDDIGLDRNRPSRHGHGLIDLPERAALHRGQAGGGLGTWPRPAGGHPRSPAADGGPMRIRVLVADDQALVRAGLRMILEAEPDVQVVGEAADGLQAVQTGRRLRPDVVLMDACLPVLDGVQATRRLIADQSGVRVLILTTVDLDEDVDAAIRAGASGFLLKDVPPAQLVEAVRVVAAGGGLLAPSVTRRLLERLARTLPANSAQPPPQLSTLTARELEILRLLATGLSNAELAKELVLAEATVKTHLSSLLRKLDRRDRVQAVILAYDAGLVRPAWADQPARPPQEPETHERMLVRQ